MPAFFLAGTDTNVGKTVVSAGLLAALSRQGFRAGYYKPLQTGSLAPLDRDAITSYAGYYATHITTHTSYQFPAPAAPLVADKLAHDGKETIDFHSLVHTGTELAASTDWLIVEGAGGIRVPITSQADMLDYIAALAFPVVLVTRPNLGTINHTRLTLDALQQAGIKVTSVVISGMPTEQERSHLADKEAIETLEDLFKHYLPTERLFTLPRFSTFPFSESDLDYFLPIIISLSIHK